VQELGHDLFDGVQADGSFESFGLEAPEPAELACLTTHERLALSVGGLSLAVYGSERRTLSYKYAVYTLYVDP
jgi:hypothetical protein